MPRFLSRRPINNLNKLLSKNLKSSIRQRSNGQDNQYSKNESASEKNVISNDLQDNIGKIKTVLNSPDDLLIRTLKMQGSPAKFAIICIDGLSDQNLINDQIVLQIQQGVLNDDSPKRSQDARSPDDSKDESEDDSKDEAKDEAKDESKSAKNLFTWLENEVLSIHEMRRSSTFDDVLLAILSGDTALLLDGMDTALLIGSQKWTGRSIEEPQTESLVRGPREGFNESIHTNTVLVRKHIRDPHLRFKNYKIGSRANKKLSIAYIEGLTHPDLVEEVMRRVQTIDIDDAPESGVIEQWIEDSFLSPFPQLLHTERPDKVAAALTQGKIAIMLDGTPFVLTMPTTFPSLIQSPEDYYERWLIGSLIRMLRYIAAALSMFLPSLYIALLSFHQGMIPPKLAFSIAAAREGVPFPAVIEAFLMEFTLELLREAGVRLPKPIGQTIGIVGGLVIGEAAVQAGIVSPIMVIVVAVTAVASFAIPSYSAGIAFRIIRFGIMIAAAVFGLYGIILCFIMICIHLSRLRSFGIPYITPFSPMFDEDWRDLFIRSPLLMLSKRPRYLQTEDEQRMNKKGNKQ